MHRIGNIILFREENLGLIVGLELMMMTKLNRRKKMLSLLGSRLPYRSCLIRKCSPETDDDTDM